MREESFWEPRVVVLRSTEDYRRLVKMEAPDSTWHCASPASGLSRLVSIVVDEPEPGVRIDLLHLGGTVNNEIIGPVPLSLFNPFAESLRLPFIPRDSMLVVGLTGKARGVRIGLSVEVAAPTLGRALCP